MGTFNLYRMLHGIVWNIPTCYSKQIWPTACFVNKVLLEHFVLCSFHTAHGVLKAGILKWFAIPFSSGPHFVPSPVDHILSLLQWTTFCQYSARILKWFAIPFSTMIHPFWVALNGMAHSFIELDKAVVHVIRLVSFL